MERVKNRRYTKQEIRRNTFYQTPKFLFLDEYEQLSGNAKLLYSLLRDRLDLSMANGWVNKDEEVYLMYTREKLAKELRVSVPTVKKYMDQLASLNLIEEQRRGLNRANLIYVLFVDIDTYIPPEHLKKDENINKENVEENNIDVNEQSSGDGYSSRTEKIFASREKESLCPEEKNLCSNQTDFNKTNSNKTNNQSIYQSIENKNDIKILIKEVFKEILKEVKNENNNNTEQKDAGQQKKDSDEMYTENQHEDTFQDIKEEEPASENSSQKNIQDNTKTNNNNKNSQKKNKKRKAKQQKKNVDKTQLVEEYNEYREVISQNIEYDTIKGDDEIITDLLEVMVDTVATKRPAIRISGVDKPAEVVKSTLLKLNCEHIQYVVECLKGCKTDIRSIRAYMLTSLYNSYSTMDTYYANRVTHDMYSDSSCA